MLTNYFKIALRSLRKHAGYAFVNGFGLAVGLAVCLIVGIFVRHELSFDRFHPNADRVFRVVQSSEQGGIATLPPGITNALENEFPQIEAASELRRLYGEQLMYVVEGEGSSDAPVFLSDVLLADTTFLDVFPYRMLRGEANTALDEPGRVVLSEGAAVNLFGSVDVLGRRIKRENGQEATVTGVVENAPSNAHFRFDALLSLSTNSRNERYGSEVQWQFFSGYVYLVLRPDVDVQALQQSITGYATANAPHGDPGLTLQPVTRVHLFSDFGNEIAPQSDVRYLYLFSGIGLLVLLIACANYINLSTARAATRLQEAGIRKVVGATRSQLIIQFMGESVLIAFLALPIAFMGAEWGLPVVNTIAGQELSLDMALDTWGLAAILGLTLTIGAFSGLYPAWLLSRPVSAIQLRGVSAVVGGGALRKTLVVGQFVISLVLIMATLVMKEQRDFVQNQNLGFDAERVITVAAGPLADQYSAFKGALLAGSDVTAVTSGLPPGLGRKNMTTSITDPVTEESTWMSVLWVDHDYEKAVGFEMAEGRFFSGDFPSDSASAVVLNPSAVRLLGLGDDPIGASIPIRSTMREVVGVTKEFHNASLHNAVEPTAFVLSPGNNWTAIIRLAPGPFSERLAGVEGVWKTFMPSRPFSFDFLDAQISAQYESEGRLARLFGIFSTIALIVACLGLLGLAAFMAVRRTKEIGIRKALGASVPGIMALLSAEFVRLVALSIVVAVPVAYLIAQKWLENFEFRIDMPWWAFALAGLSVLTLTLATVGYQAFRTASTNPVEALRYE